MSLDFIEEMLGVVCPGMFSGNGVPCIRPKFVEEGLPRGEEFKFLCQLGLVQRGEVYGVLIVCSDTGNWLCGRGNDCPPLGHVLEEFDGGSVLVAVGDDGNVEGFNDGWHLFVANWSSEGYLVLDPESGGLLKKVFFEGSVSDKEEFGLDPWFALRKLCKGVKKEIQAMPFDKPTDKPDYEMALELELLEERGGIGGFFQEAGFDCVGVYEDFFFRDPVLFLDFPFEVGGNGYDAGGVLESLLVTTLGNRGKERLFADAFVPDQFIDFYNVRNSRLLGDFASCGKEEGMAFVD